MERLTKKREDNFYELTEANQIYGEENGIRLVQILGEYEDFEGEIGIDLPTFFKALKGIWVKDFKDNRIHYVGSPYLCYAENSKRELEFQFRVVDQWHHLKDYGETWALTEEELQAKIKELEKERKRKMSKKQYICYATIYRNLGEDQIISHVARFKGTNKKVIENEVREWLRTNFKRYNFHKKYECELWYEDVRTGILTSHKIIKEI